VQNDDSVPRVVVEYRPDAQGVHKAAATMDMYVPAPQLVHKPAPLLVL
jgi:hypothetical protein